MLIAIWSFIICLVAMTAVGALSYLRKRKQPKDYLIASREVPPWLSALSAVSTNNSGFMFIAMIGYTYRLGIETIWMMVGWTLGDLCGWLFFYPRVRIQSEELQVNTMSGLLAKGRGKVLRPLMFMSGAITFLFLSVYASGQLKAGSTALHALFGWDMWVGALIATGIIHGIQNGHRSGDNTRPERCPHGAGRRVRTGVDCLVGDGGEFRIDPGPQAVRPPPPAIRRDGHDVVCNRGRCDLASRRSGSTCARDVSGNGGCFCGLRGLAGLSVPARPKGVSGFPRVDTRGIGADTRRATLYEHLIKVPF